LLLLHPALLLTSKVRLTKINTKTQAFSSQLFEPWNILPDWKMCYTSYCYFVSLHTTYNVEKCTKK